MAQPITAIKMETPSKEEQEIQRLNELKSQIAEHQNTLNKLLEIASELHDSGILESAEAMLKAKEKMAEIALHQLNREPGTGNQFHQ